MTYPTTIKIRFDDVDSTGIVYYPQYFHLCHASFKDFFDSTAYIFYHELIKRLGFPAVAIHSDFIAPLVYGDTAIINIAVKKLVGTLLFYLAESGVYRMEYYVLKQNHRIYVPENHEVYNHNR